MPAWLGLGSNEGDRRENLASAIDRIGRLWVIEAISDVYETEPVGNVDQPEFLNLVVRIRTTLEPAAVLAAVQRIEADLGRRETKRWGPRPIDIDILMYDDNVIDETDLEVPHPRMLERAFVLRPLADIDPDLVHPVTGERIEDVLLAGSFEACRRLFPGTLLREATG